MGANLITIQEYKALAGIASTTQDAAINSLIPKVSTLIKGVCRRSFVDYVDEVKTEVFKGGEMLPLAEYPVISLSAVEHSSDYGATYTELVEYTDYVLDVETECIVPIPPVTSFPRGINAYKVSYYAGFEVLPEDLKLAVADTISFYLKNDGSVHVSNMNKSSSVQVEYVSSSNLPSHIQRVLELYKANYS